MSDEYRGAEAEARAVCGGGTPRYLETVAALLRAEAAGYARGRASRDAVVEAARETADALTEHWDSDDPDIYLGYELREALDTEQGDTQHRVAVVHVNEWDLSESRIDMDPGCICSEYDVPGHVQGCDEPDCAGCIGLCPVHGGDTQEGG